MTTSPAVTARPQWSLVEAARTVPHHHVKRLPVVDDADRLGAIVSRADLLHVFLRRAVTIREESTTDVLTRSLGLSPGEITVPVTEGRVTSAGPCRKKAPSPSRYGCPKASTVSSTSRIASAPRPPVHHGGDRIRVPDEGTDRSPPSRGRFMTGTDSYRISATEAERRTNRHR
ncbi:CBS domain-containing protein [Streptomyces sp. NPDC015125]|uniref:CBS domain-containing protein n=1 Tax=Streptomyces sp. NPDC015125 TaxID=3364938 RepID=UPI0036F611D6